ncbi:MAG TPA: PQQ-binding-like beta-propeller repeat protein [Bryobacteraceae bacterium]|nr:PQQ-binding-like beta-propeller repeat protein [Bryobacteraceae bacterium]
MKTYLHPVVLVMASLSLALGAAQAQEQNSRSAGTESGFAVFQTRCMGCHGNPAMKDRAPDPATLRQLAPEKIYEALTTGPMKVQGSALTEDQRRMVAVFMSGRTFGSAQQGDAKDMPNRCEANPPMSDPSAGPEWSGWSAAVTNTRFQTAKGAGLTAEQVPHLKLKWAFGYPTGVSAFGQPAVASGRVFVGTDIGYVYSLDANSGCVYWSYAAQGNVRGAPSIGRVKGHGATKYALFFGDGHANVYAVDAQTGSQLWMRKVDDHFVARITASPKLYDGYLYVPVSSSEEFAAANLDYPCCTSRGSVVKLDANTGEQMWKTYVVPETPKPTRKNSKGVQQYAPAGASVWNSPTIDAKRHAIYFGTGDSETEPAAKMSDSVMAVDMKTGKVLWYYQAQANDAFLGGCFGTQRTDNCPTVNGPDLDIGNSPVLHTLPGGKSIVVAGTKDGKLFALDPDKKGAIVWNTHVTDNPPGAPVFRLSGIVWGGASDEKAAYYGLSGGGITAIQLTTGEKLWHKALAEPGKRVNNAAAATAMPGVVFIAGTDGKLHALATADGAEIWSYDTNHSFDTVNKVQAKGGSIASIGPTIAGGMLFIGSGYGVVSGNTGNVLLAFGVE